MLEATSIVWIIAAAVSVAMLYSYYNTRIIGDFVRKLADSGAKDTESAAVLSESGLNTVTRLAVALSFGKGSTLRKYIALEENGEGLEGRLKGRYYILPEGRDTLLKRYGGKGVSLASTVVCIVIVCIFAAIVTSILPHIYTFLGNGGYIPDDGAESGITETIPEQGDGERKDTVTDDGQPQGGSRYDTVA